MSFTRITDGDMQGKGVVGQANNPGLSTLEMQKSVEQIPREVIVPAFNKLVEQLEAEDAASNLGAKVPKELPEDTAATVQGVIEATLKKTESHQSRVDNPHAVTAAQTGAYTKQETEDAIGRRVVEIGAGDMARNVYDPTGRKTDIFAAVDKAKEDALNETAKAKEEALTAAGQAAQAAQAATSRTYTAELPAEGWAGDGETGYTQTVACEGMTAAVVTIQPMILPTGVREADIAAREALGYISMVETLEGQITVTCWEDKPTVDLTVYLVEAR